MFCFERGATTQHRDVIFSCRQLAQMRLAKSLFRPPYKGVCEPVPPSPRVSGSLPLPCPLKKSKCVFHTTMCWSVCSGMRGISPHSCSVTTTRTHGHTHLLLALRPALNWQLLLLLLLLLLCCCWLIAPTKRTQICSTGSCLRDQCFYQTRDGVTLTTVKDNDYKVLYIFVVSEKMNVYYPKSKKKVNTFMNQVYLSNCVRGYIYSSWKLYKFWVSLSG